jgi:hypothetical protein
VKQVRATASQSDSVGGVVPLLMNWYWSTVGCGTGSVAGVAFPPASASAAAMVMAIVVIASPMPKTVRLFT